MTMIIINDFVTNKRIKAYCSEDDFDELDLYWTQTDELLQSLQTTESFRGRTRWCDLDPAHYRVMIEQNLRALAKLSVEEQADFDNKTVRSLHFLVGALIRCLEERADCNIETIKISRVGERDVMFEFSCALNMEEKPKGKNAISVVVNNTKPS